MTTSTFTFHAADESDTERLGRALAEALPHGVVALDGMLGAGKTRLVQAVASAAGVDRRDVVSPTFVLVHEYHGSRPIYHLDCYRIRDDDEFLDLGADEYFREPNLVLIEWAQRVIRCLPDDRIEIAIDVLPGTERSFAITATGPTSAAAVERLRTAIQ
ncbi:MAG: tRNA (adenosine(37)-N6)-threonylcarbamoyltransferase complex ATPase subunit type 1 TsaE [Planctomycetota bacterium]|nr:MAG: tRNA (adenosine(37)-N6)-threonylcarbamoyltransferase complex ATPase subunit type 1 TsaE [Planctomycetota bacterium]